MASIENSAMDRRIQNSTYLNKDERIKTHAGASKQTMVFIVAESSRRLYIRPSDRDIGIFIGHKAIISPAQARAQWKIAASCATSIRPANESRPHVFPFTHDLKKQHEDTRLEMKTLIARARPVERATTCIGSTKVNVICIRMKCLSR